MRLCACFGVPLDVIEPAGFAFTAREMRRVAMDYAPIAEVERHACWAAFVERLSGRLVLLTTKAPVRHVDFAFAPNDVLLFGRESAGVPGEVHAAADARLRVPLRPEARSLNVAVAAGMVLGEALRQTGGFS